MSNDRTAGFVTAAVVLISMAVGGWKISTGIAVAAEAQSKALENLRTWKAAYQALLPVQKRWQSEFLEDADPKSQDLVEIGQSLRLNKGPLRYDINTLRSDRIESVSYQGVPVGLMRTCVSGGNGPGLAVTADSMKELLQGINSLIRHDIELNRIEISSREGQPTANLGGLCVLVRRES
ncbi:hypothetical protein ACI2KR_21340 [Pseudomonas luteola]